MSFLKLKKYIFYAFLLCLWLPSLAWGSEETGETFGFPPSAISCNSYPVTYIGDGIESCPWWYCQKYREQLDLYKENFQNCTENIQREWNKMIKLFMEKNRESLEACYLYKEKPSSELYARQRTVDDFNVGAFGPTPLELSDSCRDGNKKSNNPSNFLNRSNQNTNSGNYSTSSNFSNSTGNWLNFSSTFRSISNVISNVRNIIQGVGNFFGKVWSYF